MVAEKQELPIFTFNSGTDWKQLLSENHEKSEGIWLRFFEKGSGKDVISYTGALDGAICYGWIDGQIQSYNDQSYLRKFTPRRPQSAWSIRNKAHVDRLGKSGRIQPSGWEKIEKARANGPWDNAYNSSGNPDQANKE